MQVLSRSAAHRLGQVRLVGKGTNEIVSIDDALGRAESAGLDLVLVSEEVRPPVVRIQDFRKIEYEKKKARKASKKNAKSNVLKELQFKVNISEHDLETKVNKIQKFLDKHAKVKIIVRLKGREKETPERAHQLIERIGTMIDCQMSKIPGPVAMAILEPSKSAAIKH